MSSVIGNRLEKNFKKLKLWSERHRIEAYRIYDRDIPEYPFIVDRYKDLFLVHDRRDSDLDREKAHHLQELLEAIVKLFSAQNSQIIFKVRQRQKGESQYEKLSEKNQTMQIREGDAVFEVNLYDYLDTGLFLDHRLMRQRVYKEAKDKLFLNLFSYTGSVSVFAALGGAHTTSVDMSSTYTEWAKRNFEINKIPPKNHNFITQNALEYLTQSKSKFDLIFLDPPTFSNSKKMLDHFEVEKDQEFLVDACMKLLKPSGVLYFSNNKRSFKLAQSVELNYHVKDITKDTIPLDIHDQKIHKVYMIKNK